MSWSVVVIDRNHEETPKDIVIDEPTGEALAAEICTVFEKHETNEIWRLSCEGKDITVNDTNAQSWAAGSVFYVDFVHTLDQVNEVIKSRGLQGPQLFTSSHLIKQCMGAVESEDGKKQFQTTGEDESKSTSEGQRGLEDVLKATANVRP